MSKKQNRILSIALFALGLAACDVTEPVIDVFTRTEAQIDASCTEVCVEALGLENTWPLDACADVFGDEGEPEVACVLESGDFWSKNRRALQVLVAEELTPDLTCDEVCGQAVAYDDSEDLIDCMFVFTEEGEPAALCATEYNTPSSGGW